MSENDSKYCRECGAKIQRDSKFCCECGASQIAVAPIQGQPRVPSPIPPSVGIEKPKPERRMPRQRIALVAMTLAIILGGSYLMLVTRWVPVVKSYQQSEEFPYTYSYNVTEKHEVPHQESIFSSGSQQLAAFVSLSQASYYWTSEDFHLDEGWKVELTLDTDSPQTVVLDVSDGSGWVGNYYFTLKLGESSGFFIAPRSGSFHLILANYDTVSAHTASVQVSAEWTETQYEPLTQIVTKTVTFDVTRYNVTYVSPIDLLLHRA
jgi:hypothetical protein